MGFNKCVRDLIIGSNKFIDSYSEYKQAILSGQFALIGMVLCTLYLSLDLVIGTKESIPVLLATLFFLGLSIFIHRLGDHCLANYFLLPTINITVYLIAASESPSTGAFIFFIVNSIAAFSLFSYRQRRISVLFAAFSYLLFALAYLVDYSFLPKRTYDEAAMILIVVINFTAALPAALMAVFLLIRVNHHNAMKLIENNRLLTKTNAELDRFVYSTSHDLRAPLTSVLGLINITEQSKTTEDVFKYLGMMKDRVHSLDQFIHDITDYSRNNRLEIAREKVNLVGLAQELWENLKFSPEAEKISLIVDIPEDLCIDSDRQRLRVVFGNLLSNAVRYHDARKPDQFIRLHYQISGNVFSIKVEDNGQGIPKEYHNRVFEMFYRANEKSKGSGLGLYIVKEAMLKLTGSIHLDSTPGIGTVMTVKLPY